MRTLKVRLTIAAAIIMALVGLGWSFVMTNSVLPRPIAKQVTFDVFYPGDTKAYPVPKETVKYNPDTKVLTYSVMVAGKNIAVNQQPEPEVFGEAGLQVSLYQKLLEKMNQYRELKTNLGTVTLTRPDELKGGQAAVLNVSGTLLFAQPEADLSEEQWQEFFNSLISP